MIDQQIVTKQGSFSEDDYKEMKQHALYGYYLLKGVHNFSAEVILRHHRHTGGYPEHLPPFSLSFPPDIQELIDYYSKILSIIDFYDAATTRENDKLDKQKHVTAEEVRTLLLQNFPDRQEIINLCYDEKIFGGDARAIFAIDRI